MVAMVGLKAYAKMTKKKIEKNMFILDTFCVYMYHELSMICDGLPKSYLVKQRREQLNDIGQITPTPGNTEGAPVSFLEILTERVKDMSASPNTDWASQPIRVKLSGDGVKMTRNSSFILLSFSLLQGEKSLCQPRDATLLQKSRAQNLMRL
jgi:hypothetical protein